MRYIRNARCMLIAGIVILGVQDMDALAQQSAEELAKKLANPVSSLVSVPFQWTYDRNIGPVEGGRRSSLNIQPVVPMSLNEDWNLISRTIVPLIDQDDVFPGSGGQTGMGDIVQSAFFSPVAPTRGGWIWGAGPVFLLPTATDELLGTEKWGAGPTAVALRQSGPWTYGGLFNHIESFAGDSKRPGVSATLVQPFVSHTTPAAWTLSLQTEASYDWKSEQWSVPVAVSASKVFSFGRQLFNAGASLRYWAEAPETGAEGLGVRVTMTLLFPR